MGDELRARTQTKPLLLKVGAALFLTFAGFLYSQLRFRWGHRHQNPPPEASDEPSEIEGESVDSFKDEPPDKTCTISSLHWSRVSLRKEQEEASPTIILDTPVEVIADDSPGTTNSENEGYLLPEFHDLAQEGLMSVGLCSKKLPTVAKDESAEVFKLRGLVCFLQERVATLEVQLLEYYGLEEQSSAMWELENNMKTKDMEAKKLRLEINSVQGENERLRVRAFDLRETTAERDSARPELLRLDGRLGLVSLQKKENYSVPLHRSAAMKLNEGDETAEKLNSPEELEEVNRLKCENGKLVEEIKQIEIDRRADVEELVYLRWVNACLRYELRNYEPPPGKTAASELSHSSSPDSEQKAKQLLHEYANSSEDFIEMLNFDQEFCPPTEASSTDSSSSTKNKVSAKNKFLRNLKRLLMGKDKRLMAVEGNFHEPREGSWRKKQSRVSLDFQRLKKNEVESGPIR